MASVEILVPLGFFALVAYISKLIADTRIRRKAMEAHTSAETAEAVLSRRGGAPSTQSALKWGLVVSSLGAAVLLLDLFAVGFESPLAYGVMLLATGGALLSYYLVEHDAEEERAAASHETASAPASELPEEF
jgi:hypothetical protein